MREREREEGEGKKTTKFYINNGTLAILTDKISDVIQKTEISKKEGSKAGQ